MSQDRFRRELTTITRMLAQPRRSAPLGDATRGPCAGGRLPAPQYYRHSHLPGALNLPPGKVGEKVPALLPDKNAEIVLYCWDEA